MKKLGIIIATTLFTTATFAATCELSVQCKALVNASFSAGGDKTITNYVQVTCEVDGGYRTYIQEMSSWAGLFGLNRMTIPENINYIKSSGDKFVCKK